jgi:uncharacterized protein (DUF58 family)
VEPTHLTHGILLLTIVLGFFAFFFDDPTAVIAVGFLLFYLLSRSVLFTRSCSTIARSLTTERSASSPFLRQGAEVTVTTRVSTDIRSSLKLRVRDILPSGAVLISGNLSGSLKEGKLVITYTFKQMQTGKLSFGGLYLGLRDPFFSRSLILRRSEDIAPDLTIFPTAEFAPEVMELYSEHEVDRFTPLPGHGVRAFREYRPGDDLRHIDWKLSAKHRTRYVREYMGMIPQTRLYIVDLPDRSLPYDPAAFERLKESAGAAMISDRSAEGKISLMVVSGPNLIQLLPMEHNLTRLSDTVSTLAPAERLHHLYRREDIFTFRRRFFASGMTRSPFTDTLATVVPAFLNNRKMTSFEHQVAKVLSSFPASEIHIYSLALGDESHLRMISRQAVQLRVPVIFHVPEMEHDVPLPQKNSRIPVKTVEVAG